jgi:hypothetical protein
LVNKFTEEAKMGSCFSAASNGENNSGIWQKLLHALKIFSKKSGKNGWFEIKLLYGQSSNTKFNFSLNLNIFLKCLIKKC